MGIKKLAINLQGKWSKCIIHTTLRLNYSKKFTTLKD